MKGSMRLLTAVVILVVLAGADHFANSQSAQPTSLATVSVTSAATSIATESLVFPRTVKDGAGNDVTLPAQPKRIISLALGSDEILLALVDSTRIVALSLDSLDSTQSNVVDDSKRIAYHFGKPDATAILELKPDLVVVTPTTDAEVIKRLKDNNIAVLVISTPNNIKEIEENISRLGAATATTLRAADLVSHMQEKLAAVADSVKNVKPQVVLYYAPNGRSYGSGTLIDDIITQAGGINAVTAGGIKDPTPQVDDAFVVQQDPDLILLAGYNSYSPGFVDKFNANPNFQALKAVDTKRVVVANDAHIASVSQYAAEGVVDIAALLYPDAYQPTAAVPVNAATASATKPQGGLSITATRLPTLTPSITATETPTLTETPSATFTPTATPTKTLTPTIKPGRTRTNGQ